MEFAEAGFIKTSGKDIALIDEAGSDRLQDNICMPGAILKLLRVTLFPYPAVS
jgi:hypothetical protein